MDVITRSLQVYRYARNSPLTHHDPSGLLEKGNCSAYYITHLLPKPTPWKTADFPKAKAGKLEGLTIVDEWSITCTCKTRRCIDVPEGVVGWFTCPPGTARLCCDIVLKIPFILISADVDKDLRIWIWGHEMFHVRHYQDKTREVWGRLGKSQECLPASECDEQKKKTLDDIQKELQAFADDEAQHKNFKDPKPGEYYAFPTPPEFPHAPIGHEPKPPIEIK
jgi:hypothetical protein